MLDDAHALVASYVRRGPGGCEGLCDVTAAPSGSWTWLEHSKTLPVALDAFRLLLTGDPTPPRRILSTVDESISVVRDLGDEPIVPSAHSWSGGLPTRRPPVVILAALLQLGVARCHGNRERVEAFAAELAVVLGWTWQLTSWRRTFAVAGHSHRWWPAWARSNGTTTLRARSGTCGGWSTTC
jgi:hypothetical protein